jgi:hypothetical protein
MRGDSLRNKKELIVEVENPESLEEDNILTSEQYAKKGEVQSSLMKIHEEDEQY